ncbi:MAG: putative undecaprenyl-phosphate N-acetylgalactosaminyl 1-phosphate transferase [Planctomycetota bacterium]|jgi:sugar transferase (PEP-CTERM system associated)
MPTLAEQIFPRRKLLLIASESVLLTGLLFAGTNLPPVGVFSEGMASDLDELLRTLASCFIVAGASQVALSYNDLYDWRVSQNRAELPNRLLYALGHALVVVALLILAAPSLFHFPGIAAETGKTYRLIGVMAASFGVLFAWRLTFHWFFFKWRFGEQVLILGTDTSAQQIGQMVVENPLSGFELVGLVAEDAQTELAPAEVPWKRVLGRIEDLPELCVRHGIARVLVCLRERRGRVPVEALLDVRMQGILVEEREAMYERLAGKLAIESMRPSYLIYNQGFGKHPTTLALKRCMDVALSVLGLVLSMPICLLATVAILATSRGPLFFVQERVGQDGKVFRLVKFRTMRPDAERETGPVWAKVDDDRITPVGRFLRITRIDEIPQFLNVLAGHMSFVGPRPERPHFVAQLTKQLPFYPLRHTVKPGLTGWAQVRIEYGASVEDAMEKLRYDLYYLKNMSALFDMNIVLRTIGVILLGKGAR